MEINQSERWKNVVGYEGYYIVSDTGRVRSLDRVIRRSDGVVQTRRGKEKKQHKDKDGYMKVKLSKDGIDKLLHVHKLVATAFLENADSGLEVNHIDFDRTNNRASNLEWVSHSENIAHTLLHGRHVSQRDLSGVNNPNFGNRVLHDRYSSDREYAKEKQSRKGAQNGTAKAISAKLNEGWMSFAYIALCAKYLIDNHIVRAKSVATVSSAISTAAKTGRQYYGLSFKYQ